VQNERQDSTKTIVLFWLGNLQRDFIVFCSLATFSLGIGLIVNHFRDKPISLVYQTRSDRLMESVANFTPLEDTRTATRTELPKVISLKDFAGYVEKGGGVILDARPEVFFRLGHVPGALSLPRDDFGKAYPILRDKLECSFDQPIVIYCSRPSCEDAELVRIALSAIGFRQLSVFEAGWVGWVSAGKPTEAEK